MPHTRFNNQRHIWQVSQQAGPTPQCSLCCLYPHPLFRWAKGGGALCPQSHAPSVLCPLHCRLACNCGSLLTETLSRATTVPLSSGRLTIAAVSELAVLSNLQFGGVGGGDAVTGLHAVPLFQLCEGTHEAGIGSIQRGNALFLWAKRALVALEVGTSQQ